MTDRADGPTLRTIRGAQLTEGDVLWLWIPRGGWRVDRLEPYRGVNVETGRFPVTTRVAFVSANGRRVELTVHPDAPYDLVAEILSQPS